MRNIQTKIQTIPNKLPTQILFQPPQFHFYKNYHKLSPTNAEPNEVEIQSQNIFSTEERQSLKNAFRYICRLGFKEAIKYKEKVKQLAKQSGMRLKNDEQLLKLFKRGEEISGERYFRKYINALTIEEQKTICQYLHWFLVKKYLRYISQEGKGKRKKMKRALYIKFKNDVMLPYIISFLE